MKLQAVLLLLACSCPISDSISQDVEHSSLKSNNILHHWEGSAYPNEMYFIPPSIKKTYQINLFNISYASNAGSAKFTTSDYLNFNLGAIKSSLLKRESTSTGIFDINLRGPGVFKRVGNRNKVGISTGVQFLSNFTDINRRLASEIAEDKRQVESYPYILPPQSQMTVSTIAYSFVSFNFEHRLLTSDMDGLSIFMSLKALNGIGHFSIRAEELAGTIDINKDNVPLLRNASGKIGTITSGDAFTSTAMGNIFRINQITPSIDIGIKYTFRPRSDPERTLDLALAITDIGTLKFSPDSTLSRNYEININTPNALYFNNNFKNSNIGKTANVLDSFPKLFSRTSSIHRRYNVILPTALHVLSQYKISTGLAVGAHLAYYIFQDQKRFDRFYKNSSIELRPTWRRSKLSVGVPFTVRKNVGFTVGTTVLYRNVYVTSTSLLSSFINSRHLDILMGIAFEI